MKIFSFLACSFVLCQLKLYSCLKSDFVSPYSNSIQNLNNFLDIFEDCLTHLINYKGLDFEPLNYPVVLSRYVSIPRLNELDTSEYYFNRTNLVRFEDIG